MLVDKKRLHNLVKEILMDGDELDHMLNGDAYYHAEARQLVARMLVGAQKASEMFVEAKDAKLGGDKCEQANSVGTSC
mgnify:CR=1 FL=1